MQQIPLPNHIEQIKQDGNSYTFVIEPCYPGYGMTLGTALRRVLLSSLPGAAIKSVRIKGVDHEFSTVPGVKEDMIEILLNLKKLRLRVHSDEDVRLELKKKGQGTVTAGDFKKNTAVEIVNPDHYIATVDGKSADFDMEVIVGQGRGYATVETREGEEKEIGMIAIDANYTPVQRVNVNVQNVRVGGITNFDKLTIEMMTDGTITGHDAIKTASQILVDHFTLLLNGGTTADSDPNVVTKEQLAGSITPLAQTGLSNRALNALTKHGIMSTEELLQLSDDELAQIKGLGDKSMDEIKDYIKNNR